MTTWTYRITLALILAVIFYLFYPTAEENPRPVWWGIEASSTTQTTSDISILGFQLGKTNLQDISFKLKSMPSTALFTTRQRQGDAEPAMHLEAYFEDVYDEGDRVVIRLAADYKLLKHIKTSALQPELFPNDVIRVAIPQELIEEVSQLALKSMTLIAGEQVKFEAFKEKYGEPSQLIDDGQGNAHFLYPKLGLDFIQPADGLQILQFVLPRRFEKELLQPLMSALPKRKV